MAISAACRAEHVHCRPESKCTPTCPLGFGKVWPASGLTSLRVQWVMSWSSVILRCVQLEYPVQQGMVSSQPG